MSDEYNINNENENVITPDNVSYPGDEKKPKSKVKPIIAMAALIVVIAGTVGFFLFPRSVLGKNSYILTALRNTFVTGSDDNGTEIGKFAEAGKCAIDIQFATDDFAFSMEGDVDQPEKQLSANVSFSSGDQSVSVKGTIDDTYFKFTVPEMVNGVFEYNYTQENTGYLADMISQAGMDISEFNEMFSQLFEMPTETASLDDYAYTKMLLDDFNLLEFDKVGEKEFSVAGGQKGCEGYKAVVTKEIVEAWLKNYEDLNPLSSANIAVIRQALTDYTELALTVYIADDKVAAVEFEEEDDMVAIKFEGVEKPLDNIVISSKAEGEESDIRIDTTRENAETKIVMTMAGEEIMTASYNSETGKISVKCGPYDDTISFDGTFKYDDKSVEFVIDRLTFDGESISGMFRMSDEVSIETIDPSLPTLDAGNATEQEFSTFVMNNMNLQGIFSDGLGPDESYDDYDLEGLDADDLEGLDLEDWENLDA